VRLVPGAREREEMAGMEGKEGMGDMPEETQ
jgi:hypothetical protein